MSGTFQIQRLKGKDQKISKAIILAFNSSEKRKKMPDKIGSYLLRTEIRGDFKIHGNKYFSDAEWSKVVTHATTSNEGNQRPKYLQNFDEKLNMGKHPFILVSTI